MRVFTALFNTPASTDNDAVTDPRVEREKVDLLVKGFTTAIVSTLTGPLISAWLFAPYVGLFLAWAPSVLIYALLAERWMMLLRFRRARVLPSYDPTVWGRAVSWRLGVMSVVLGVWMMATIATRNETAMFYALALIALLSAGALTQFCIYPHSLLAFATPLMLGVVAELIWLGSRNAWVSAVYLFVLWVTLVAASVRFARVIHSDIVLRYQNQALVAELSKQKDVAEAASEAKSRFLAAASHDLRQPVHAVSLLAAALRDRTADGEQQALLTRLQGGVAHFSDVVDEVLDIARLDANAVPLSMQAVRVQDLLDRLDSTYHALASAKGVGLMFRPPACADAAIQADPALTWRVLSNLVGNAVRYTQRGSVLVAVRRDTAHGDADQTGPVSHPATALHGPPSAWRIEVRDSGPGIDPQQQGLIFEEFYQLHNPQRDSKQGLGLGLSVARRMASLMGMQIKLRSCSGHGATFSIAARAVFPTVSRASGPTDGWQQNNSAPVHNGVLGLRVLVVDDDADALRAMEALLQSWGVNVQLASSVDQAVLCVGEGFEPQVLITDHWLGNAQSAFSVAEQVQSAMASQATLSVAVFTGDISLGARQAVAAKGWHFAPKPVRPLALRMWLESVAVHGVSAAIKAAP